MLVAGDVLGDVGAGTFGVAHLPEDTSARAGDAFDGFERSVGIELVAVRGRAARMALKQCRGGSFRRPPRVRFCR